MREIDQARSMMEQASTVTLVSHERPDGDGVGSLLALSLSLEEMGKAITPVSAEGVPEQFNFLPGAQKIVKRLPRDSDLIVVVDCSDLPRTAFKAEQFPHPPDLNIDHHPTNSRFARVNIVVPTASATSEIIYHLASDIDLPITWEVATNLMAGLLSDTIGFRTSSVTPQTLRMAAQLLEEGVPHVELYERLLNRRSFISARYWGSGLSRLQRKGNLIWTSLTLEDREKVGYSGAGDADLIDLLTTIEGAKTVVIFVEQPGHKVKVSWRSLDGKDVSRLAQKFGGGGHAPAAGALIPGDLESVQSRVLAATRANL